MKLLHCYEWHGGTRYRSKPILTEVTRAATMTTVNFRSGNQREGLVSVVRLMLKHCRVVVTMRGDKKRRSVADIVGQTSHARKRRLRWLEADPTTETDPARGTGP